MGSLYQDALDSLEPSAQKKMATIQLLSEHATATTTAPQTDSTPNASIPQLLSEHTTATTTDPLTDSTPNTRRHPRCKRAVLAAIAAMAVVLCAVITPLLLNSDRRGFESGFTVTQSSSDPIPDYPYYRVFCAYRFSQRKFALDNVTVEFYYGHALPDTYYDRDEGQFLPCPLQNAASDTNILLIDKLDTHRSVLKKIDNFLSNNHSATTTLIDPHDNLFKIDYKHSETLRIPEEAFINTYGYFSLCVDSVVTDENVKPIFDEPSDPNSASRGWGFGCASRIYYFVKDGSVKLGDNYEHVIPREYWSNI